VSWLEVLREKLPQKPTGEAVAKGAKVPLATLATTPLVDIPRIFSEPGLPLEAANASEHPEEISDTQVEFEARYGRVTCHRCSHLTHAGVCRPLSVGVRYTPLEYLPVAAWRRCDHYLPKRLNW
jgi:hypothetical protein